MPLPDSGPISTADINTELGNDAGTTVDIDDVATNTFGLDRPHGFNEFYGLGTDNFATSITNISPSSITDASAQGQTTTVSYDSDGGFKINDDNISWASVSIGSGSEGTGNTFDIVITAQELNALARNGSITLESPSMTNITYNISQLANDATLTISRQTGIMSYGYNGGTGEYYKIETSPESEVTWIASIGNTTYFSHRIYNSGNSFTTSNLSGTGDEFIEVKAEVNDTEQQQSGTITVDPQNIDDPTVTDTVFLAKEPTFSLSPATSINNIDWFSTSNFSYNVYGSSNAVRFTVTSNYDIDTITDDSSNWTSTKYSSTQFDVYPTSLNSSSSTRTVTVSINMNSNPTTTYTVQVSQGGAPAASITSTGTSDWSYNEYGSGQYKTISVTISNYPATNPTLTLNMFDNGKFAFRTDLITDVTYTDDIDGVKTIAQKSTPGNGTHYFHVYPVDQNNTASDVSASLAVTLGSATGTITLTQLAQPDFTYPDAFVQGFNVGYEGNVTAPYAVNGTITDLTYSTDYDSETNSYPVVSTPTDRSVYVEVQVPSGWPNENGYVYGTETDEQPVPPRLVQISAYNGISTTIAGNTSSFVFSVDDVYYTNTSWTLTHEGGSTPLQGVYIVTTSGTGDTTLLTVTFSQNLNTGIQRRSVFRVTSSEGYSDDITLTQNSYTPPPSISITSVSPSGPYSYSGESGISFTVNSSNGSFSAEIGGYEISPTFPTNQPSGITRTSSTQLSSNGTATQFYVDIPARTDGLTTPKSAFITVSTSNAGGPASDSYTLEQSGLVTWSRTPSTLSFVYTGGTGNVTLSSNLSWTASISGTGFSITSGGTSGTGNNTFTITAADNSNGGARSGTLTLSASGQSDLTVSLSQAGAPLEYYYYVNGSSTGETSFPRSLGTLGYFAGGYSIGFYTYIGSNAVASPFELTKSIAGSWYGVATTTTGKLTTAASTTTQSTGANAAKLYINIDSNAGNGSSRAFEVDLSIEGAYIGSFAGTQAADPNAGGSSGGDGPSCLVRGTKITMADGSIKRIQNLQVGDVLKSWNIDGMSDGEYESLLFNSNNLNYIESTTTVVSVKTYNVDRIYIFENDNQRILQSTHEHQHFICRNGTYWFTSPEAVREGDFLVKENGDLIEIHRVYELSNAGSFDVYKVDVEDLDLYIANGILTHNAKGEPQV